METSQRNRQKENGQMLVEFIVAMGILIIVIAGGTIALIGSLTAGHMANERTRALGYASEALEAVKSVRNRSWDNLANGTYGVDFSEGYWTLSDSPEIKDEKYTQTVIIEDAIIDEEILIETKKITALVSWNSSPTAMSQVDVSTYLTNWQTVRAEVPGTKGVGNCEDYCLSRGHPGGACQGHSGQCENYYPISDQFCEGNPSRNTCCCYE